MKLSRTIPLLLVASVALSACKQETESASPDAAPPVQAGPVDDTDDEDAGKARVNIDPRIAEMCGISEPSFDYNSAKLSSKAKKTLDTLATCFLEGPASGEKMSLVGHADPRGSEDYNFALGQRRAGNVGNYLDKRGLSDERVVTSSRGELDAMGTDEASWGADRRVEILLAD